LKDGSDDECMDLLAIVIAVAFFALMALVIEGLERV
jgi:hypothetical protein